MPKQVRFAQLIKAAGRPHAATLWVARPTEDPDFQRAIAEDRILSVHNVNVGSKKESAEIGFREGRGLSYMIFDKPLPFASGTRVIGLKFDELAQANVTDPVKIKPALRKSRVEKVKIVEFPSSIHAPSQAAEKHAPEDRVPLVRTKSKVAKAQPPKTVRLEKAVPRFIVTVEFTASFTSKVEVEAATAASALEQALAQASEPTGTIKWRREAVEVHRRK